MKNLTLDIKKTFLLYIYAYIFILPWDLWKPQMGIFSIILFVAWLSLGKKYNYFNKLKLMFQSLPLIILFLFFTYAFLSLLWTNNIQNAFETFFRFFKYYLIVIPVLFTALNKEEATKSLYIFILSLSLYSLFSLGIYLEIFHIYDSTKSNPKGVMAYAIVTPYMAVATLSLTIFAIYSKAKMQKYIFYILAFLAFLALFINNGRAGQFAFFITIFIFLFFYFKLFIKKPKILIAILLLLMGSVYLLNSFHKLHRIEQSFYNLKKIERNQFSGSWGTRANLWYAAGNILHKNLIIGIGAGDNIDKLYEYEKSHPSHAELVGTFHNQHLDLLTRFGIVGYFLFWSAPILLLYQLRNNQFYFNIGLIFFSITFFDGIGDIILLMKPYNNVFILVFILLSIIATNKKKSTIIF